MYIFVEFLVIFIFVVIVLVQLCVVLVRNGMFMIKKKNWLPFLLCYRYHVYLLIKNIGKILSHFGDLIKTT